MERQQKKKICEQKLKKKKEMVAAEQILEYCKKSKHKM
jgi:hypothetical protein